MKLINASKTFKSNNNEIVIIKNQNIEFKKGNFYAIMGHSGSGKTTLINILGMIDNLDDGNLIIDNKNINDLTEKEKCNIRNNNIGFVFQDYYLNEYMTALENVMLPIIYKNNVKNKKQVAINMLNEFDLKDHLNYFPKKLSGGERQRVAIARALINSPQYLLCDEPTGALDKTNSKKVFKYLKELTKKDICVIVVSHDSLIKEYADFIYELDMGKISEVKNDKK